MRQGLHLPKKKFGDDYSYKYETKRSRDSVINTRHLCRSNVVPYSTRSRALPSRDGNPVPRAWVVLTHIYARQLIFHPRACPPRAMRRELRPYLSPAGARCPRVCPCARQTLYQMTSHKQIKKSTKKFKVFSTTK